ncbi:MAG: SH3 domain-containing protein [Humidesulfovibrio sp.]|uniref:SH3 domain-containing protein n=1 Tax=Humidesulfovibrio sp. TaxID=2910988 RepID=UPI0027EB7A7C|nr:SH3 domain-containing protein [Humidesulfovibrio sp.]MDQ7835711.1 SH3 domain-containing protein [Humidesulfovibrio sp.]
MRLRISSATRNCARQFLPLLAVLTLAVGGCAPAPRPPAPPKPPVAAAVEQEPQDLRDFPQNATALLAQASATAGLEAPFLSPEAQARFLERFRAAHFGPWAQANATFGPANALWGLGKLSANSHYGENLRPLGQGFRAEMEAQCQAWSYPSPVRMAIATSNTDLRVLPTIRPGFLKPTRPGEGYPFDYWQNSGVWAGTPLVVTHLSADGAWALVEARNAGGWVRVADIAYVDETFMALWRALPLLAVTREHTPVTAPADKGGVNLFDGRIGTVLPLLAEDESGYTALAPARGVDGQAVAVSVRIAKADAAAMPLAATPRNLARLADQVLGQPYGWGGYLQNRDCSALMLDVLAPFGLFLPRNSGQQAKAGEYVSFEGLTGPQKEALVLSRGVPLLTLLYKRGHIMLYLGQFQGRAAMLHAVWGLKTLSDAGAEGRKVIGRTAITSLEPGRELPEVARSGTLLEHMAGMTLLAPGGNPPATPDRTR